MSLTIEITSVPDRDQLVAEIWHDDGLFAEVRKSSSENWQVEIYAKKAAAPWLFDLQEVYDALMKAQKRLTSGQGAGSG
jgi:hypothetical protein